MLRTYHTFFWSAVERGPLLLASPAFALTNQKGNNPVLRTSALRASPSLRLGLDYLFLFRKIFTLIWSIGRRLKRRRRCVGSLGSMTSFVIVRGWWRGDASQMLLFCGACRAKLGLCCLKTKNGLWNRRRSSRYTVSNAIPYNPSVVSTLKLANREP